MSYVRWTERLATGIEEIDADHKTLFDLVDQFHEAYAAGKGPGALENLFATLMRYTDRHFAREEQFLREIDYPALDVHHAAHRTLESDLADLHGRYLRGERRGEERDLCLEMLAFLSNWLHFHITEEDMKYRDYLLSRK